MPRRNPLLFKQDEYQFLHKVYLLKPTKSKMWETIKGKKGIGLTVDEIMFVKEKFAEWQIENPNELLWMRK